MNAAVIEAAASVLEEHAGLRPTDATRARLEAGVRARAGACSLTPEAYVERLRVDSDETQVLIDGLTVKETSFFRDADHLDALVRHVIPSDDRPVVVWSAGCATGQEPYSIAMALDEAGVRDYRIVATDLSRSAVQRTREGLYSENELRGLSAARRGRYLRREGSQFRMDPGLARRVDVRHHSLLQDRVPLGPREAIAVFCRNVLIYLDRVRVATFLDDLRVHLERNGVLFLGGSESLWNVPDGYALERLGSAYVYRLVDGVDTPSLRRPAVATASTATDTGARHDLVPGPFADVARRVAPVDVPDVVPVVPAPASAVEAFRRAAYMAPDDPLAHLQLGLSLDAEGDTRSSRRAYRAALAALDRSDIGEIEIRLEGYGIDALRTMITTKLSEGDPCL